MFCDEDGDGWVDVNELGVFGVNVYIDMGCYVIMDFNGFYYFLDVVFGLYMVKVDEDIVFLGSLLVMFISCVFYVSLGIF